MASGAHVHVQAVLRGHSGARISSGFDVLGNVELRAVWLPSDTGSPRAQALEPGADAPDEARVPRKCGRHPLRIAKGRRSLADDRTRLAVCARTEVPLGVCDSARACRHAGCAHGSRQVLSSAEDLLRAPGSANDARLRQFRKRIPSPSGSASSAQSVGR